jgi:predicted RND superfamily exporter protein
MEKQLEYFDVLANTQKQVLGNLVTAQKDLRTQLLDGMSKVQTTLTSIPGVSETPQSKEALNQFNSWFNIMISSTKSFSEEALKMQENLNSAFEKQLDISRNVVKGFSELAKTATDTVVAATKAKTA